MSRVVVVLASCDADDLDFDAEMAPYLAKLRMAYAEAGYPDAHVYNESTGIFVDGVPEDVKQRGFDLIDLATVLPSVERFKRPQAHNDQYRESR